MPGEERDPYFRGDQNDGITAPDLSKDCTFVEHIVRAREKRTKFTSVARDSDRIRDMGEAIYELLRELVDEDQHHLHEHADLMRTLRLAVRDTEKAERARAIQAIRYCEKRTEGLIEWTGLDHSRIGRKDLISWAGRQVQKYFRKVQHGRTLQLQKLHPQLRSDDQSRARSGVLPVASVGLGRLGIDDLQIPASEGSAVFRRR